MSTPVHLAGADFRGAELWDIAAAALGKEELERITRKLVPANSPA